MPTTICVALPGRRNTAAEVSASLRPHSNTSNHQYSGSYVSHSSERWMMPRSSSRPSGTRSRARLRHSSTQYSSGTPTGYSATMSAAYALARRCSGVPQR